LTIIANTLGLKRVDLKKKVRAFLSIFFSYTLALRARSQLINAPEVNQVLPEIPVLGDPVKNLYECHYDKFFITLGLFSPHSQPPNLHPTISSCPRTNTPHIFTSSLPPRAFLHKRNAHSRVHAATRELSKFDPGQPVFGVWGRQELGRRVSVLSCHLCRLSSLLP
jgi:hypothetical protein